MTTKFLQQGDVLSYQNSTGSDINADDVVEIQNIVGVALADIPDGESGSVRVTGVFSLAKTSGTAWTQGDTLDWDTSEGEFHKGLTPSTGDITGCAVAAEDAASGDATGQVLLNRLPGTIN
jgi:predicted RecA/RadA family phage recombinase